MTSMAANYPIQLAVDATAAQGRLGVFFRIILAIPHLIILYFLEIAQFVITFLAWFAIMFTGRYPAGMLGFSIGATRWQARANAYMSLLTSVYPPFSLDAEDDYPIRLMVAEQIEGRDRLTTFFRIFLVLPHIVVLVFLSVAQLVITIIAWFAIMFTGRYPAGMLRFSTGVLHWTTRVRGYGFLLTDQYPPFNLEPEGSYPVRLSVAEQLEGRSRLKTFFRIFLVAPHFVVMRYLDNVALVIAIYALVVGVILGRVPQDLHHFLVGYNRWSARLSGSFLLLVDEYPPFGFD